MTGKDLKYKIESAGFALSDVALALDISPQNLQNKLNSQDVKVSFLLKVAGVINKSIDYFLVENWTSSTGGSGDKKNVDLIVDPIVDLIPKNDPDLLIKGQKRGSIILVPVKARAGYLSGYGDPEYIESLESFDIPGCHNGNYRIFEVEGYSMYPTFAPGDYVVGERILSPGEVRSDTIYIIVSKRDGIIIKRSINNSFNNSVMSLRSDNLDRLSYPEINMSLSEVAEIWRFYMLITRLTGEQGRVMGHLQHLEGQVNQVLKLLKKK